MKMLKVKQILLLALLLVFALVSCQNETQSVERKEVNFDFDKKVSSYKHVNNGGVKDDEYLPYNIDAITGATMTIEGAGVYTSIPLSLREIENEVNGQARGIYRDKNGSYYYEGLDLYYLLNNMQDGDNAIKLTDKSYKVVLKNSNRENISEFTLDEVKKAHNDKRPILLAYGVGDVEEKTIAPFVYDGKEKGSHSLGYVDKLKNEDGCIKLVYDVNTYGKNKYKVFSNVAYVYVMEHTEPGFKHVNNTVNPLFNNSEYVDYIITFRGSELKNEFTMTIKDIENAVKYDNKNEVVPNGLGYRDQYSLANNAYWYVNTYEGVDLYKYLLYLGMENANDMGLKKARTTLVKFIAADGMESNETFSIDALSYKDAFGFYKKNSNDKNDGTYISTNEDLVKLGYPVLIAYGVNNYPYVISKADEAYISGLSNSGGPAHVVFGKTEYNHPNGSNQIQYLDTIVVGDDILYNTHTYTDNNSIKKLKDDVITVTIKNENDEIIEEKKISVEDIENLIYGQNTSKQDLKLYKIKDHYEVKDNEDKNVDSDIYEGIDLSNFLLEYIKLTGLNGRITFSNEKDSISLDLDLLFKDGFNTILNRKNLKPILAFAKNGKALVQSEYDEGYTKEIKLHPLLDEKSNYKVDNKGGPLAVIVPSSNISSFDGKYISNVKNIVIKLDVDKYSHIYNDEDNLKDYRIIFSGPGLEKETSLKVSEIEELQTKIKTMSFMENTDDDKVVTMQYRGMPLYELLKIIGIKNNAGDVTITSKDGNSISLSLSKIKNKYEKVAGNTTTAMLAYGSKNDNSSDGQALSLKDGGPIKFILPKEDGDNIYVDRGNSINCVQNIYVSANEIDSWSHSISDIYNDFLDNTFTIIIKTDTNEIEKEYTLKELESMTELIVRDKYYVLNIGDCEGIDVWKLINKVHKIDEKKLVSVIFYAEDGYKNDVLSVIGLNALRDGVEFNGEQKKVLLVYAVNGYPLVDNENHEGYTGLAKNVDGPTRLIVENVQGASVKKCNKVVVTLSSDNLNE